LEIISAGSEIRRNIIKYDHVHEVGQVSHPRVLKLIKSAKITIAPSIWDEPLGRLPIESAALGSVCISSSNGGLPEANQYGIIINNINPTKINKALLKLSSNKIYNQFQNKYLKIIHLQIKIIQFKWMK
jgi:glycosyltransferase involved in cell wall biosynthesis